MDAMIILLIALLAAIAVIVSGAATTPEWIRGATLPMQPADTTSRGRLRLVCPECWLA